ncbi:MAG: YciI family protein [Sphingomonadales bacterium]|jgi:uncharacterized protein YciI
MIFSAYCLDGVKGPQIRASDVRTQHLAHLEEAGDMLKFAGPLLNADCVPIGSLLMFEAENAKAAWAFLDKDPYSKAGLFERIDLRAVKAVKGAWID